VLIYALAIKNRHQLPKKCFNYGLRTAAAGQKPFLALGMGCMETAFELRRRSGSISNLGAAICPRPQIPNAKFMKCSILCEFQNSFRAQIVNNFPEKHTTGDKCNRRSNWGIKVQALGDWEFGIGDWGLGIGYIWLPTLD